MKKNLLVFILCAWCVYCNPSQLFGQQLPPTPTNTKDIHTLVDRLSIYRVNTMESFFDLHNKWYNQATQKTSKVLCNPQRYFSLTFPPSQEQSIQKVLAVKFKTYEKFFTRHERLQAIFNTDWFLSVYALTGSIDLAAIPRRDFQRLEKFFQEKNVPILDFKLYENTPKGNVLIVHISGFQIVFFTDRREIQIFDEKGPKNT